MPHPNVGKFRAGNKYFQGGAVGAYSDVRFENCDFIQNGAADETAFAPSIRGGGATFVSPMNATILLLL